MRTAIALFIIIGPVPGHDVDVTVKFPAAKPTLRVLRVFAVLSAFLLPVENKTSSCLVWAKSTLDTDLPSPSMRETEIASDLRIEIWELYWARQCSHNQQTLARFQNKKRNSAVNHL
jgi:hypothetical protein